MKKANKISSTVKNILVFASVALIAYGAGIKSTVTADKNRTSSDCAERLLEISADYKRMDQGQSNFYWKTEQEFKNKEFEKISQTQSYKRGFEQGYSEGRRNQ